MNWFNAYEIMFYAWLVQKDMDIVFLIRTTWKK